MSTHLAKELQANIDFEIMQDLYRKVGWTTVKLDRFLNNQHATDIVIWVQDNIKHRWIRNGSQFVFENSKDAMWFTLKWSS